MKQTSKTAEKPKANLFTSAKKVETVKDNKSKIISLPVTPELEKHIKSYSQAKSEVKNWEAKQKMSEGIIKDKARELYLEEYKRTGRNICSFKLGDVTVSIQDRYSSLSPEAAEIVEKNFPNVIEQKKEYLFNQKVLEKYIEPISEALQNAEGIPEEELSALIEVKETTIVKKGTIDTLAKFGERMPDLFYAISPIISMR